MQTNIPAQDTGPWDGPTLAQLRELDLTWADQCLKMSANPWMSGILPFKTVELVALAWCSACTNLNTAGTRRHVRGALHAGATREEVLMVLKMATLLSIHTCSLAAPILLEEAKAAGVQPAPKTTGATPVCDQMKAAGQWNAAWEPFFALDPTWTEAFIAAGAPVYIGNIFSPKLAELLSIAFDASITHMYGPGTRRHIKSALAHGATVEEIMEVLKICVSEGVEACNMGMPILADELKRIPVN
jgi:alkylhydroperoxidase/carboxymuconolactone decarboxylase family protein YurZ